MRVRLAHLRPQPGDDHVRLVDERDIWAGYDPIRVRHALQRSTGALRDVDCAPLLRDLAAQRGQDSHGRPA